MDSLDTVVVNGNVDFSGATIVVAGGDTPAYNAGNGAWVVATGGGVTFTKSAGTGTFSVPTGVILKKFRIHGSTVDLAPDFSFTLVLNGASESHNDIFPPMVMKYNRNVGSSPKTNPWDYDIDNTPKISIIDFNPVKLRLINMNAYAHWGLIGTL